MKQIDSMLPFVCSVIDHRGCQNVIVYIYIAFGSDSQLCVVGLLITNKYSTWTCWIWNDLFMSGAAS